MADRSPISRRDMLAATGTGLGLLGLALLEAQANPLAPKKAHFAPRAKRIIHLFMNGGPSQVDTFDPKPLLAKHNGKKPSAAGLKTERGTRGLMMSPFKFAKHGNSGIEVSDLFPNVARHADKLCVVRSMHTNVPNHEPSLLMMNSGETQPTRPSMGSWLLYGLGAENQNLPGFMVLCPGKPVVGPQLWSSSFLPGIYQGTHISAGRIDPRTAIPYLGNPGMGLKAQREQLDLLKRMNEIHLARRGGHDNPLEARIQSLEMAFRMQTEAQDAFDLGKETRRVRDGYGTGYFADACLLSRRLVERGVRMVQIYTGRGQPWDDHGNILDHRKKAQQVDRPIAALLGDLEARGLLERHPGPVGRRVRAHAHQRGCQGPRPQQPRLHGLAGRRRLEAGHRGRGQRRVRLRGGREQGACARPARHPPAPDGAGPREADLPLRRARLPPDRRERSHRQGDAGVSWRWPAGWMRGRPSSPPLPRPLSCTRN